MRIGDQIQVKKPASQSGHFRNNTHTNNSYAVQKYISRASDSMKSKPSIIASKIVGDSQIYYLYKAEMGSSPKWELRDKLLLTHKYLVTHYESKSRAFNSSQFVNPQQAANFNFPVKAAAKHEFIAAAATTPLNEDSDKVVTEHSSPSAARKKKRSHPDAASSPSRQQLGYKKPCTELSKNGVDSTVIYNVDDPEEVEDDIEANSIRCQNTSPKSRLQESEKKVISPVQKRPTFMEEDELFQSVEQGQTDQKSNAFSTPQQQAKSPQSSPSGLNNNPRNADQLTEQIGNGQERKIHKKKIASYLLKSFSDDERSRTLVKVQEQQDKNDVNGHPVHTRERSRSASLTIAKAKPSPSGNELINNIFLRAHSEQKSQLQRQEHLAGQLQNLNQNLFGGIQKQQQQQLQQQEEQAENKAINFSFEGKAEMMSMEASHLTGVGPSTGVETTGKLGSKSSAMEEESSVEVKKNHVLTGQLLQSKSDTEMKNELLVEVDSKPSTLSTEGSYDLGDRARKIVSCRPNANDILMDIEWHARSNGVVPTRSSVSSKIVRQFNSDMVIDFYELRVKFTLKNAERKKQLLSQQQQQQQQQQPQQQQQLTLVKNEHTSPKKEE